MPRGDGTGPMGQGPKTGKGMGGSGQGQGGGRGQGRRPGAGPGGDCVCPACGQHVPHRPSIPCSNERCPKCGAAMTRPLPGQA
jgi:hypothetical protein